jgi:2'-5' RNA ligase
MLKVDFRLYEYLLVISPSALINIEISRIKLGFQEDYGCEQCAYLKPHITLLNFIQYGTMEQKVVDRFERFTRSVAPENIELDGFGSFQKHTIYVNVLTKAPIVKLVKGMRKRFTNILRPSVGLKTHFITNPHITIARGMTEEQHTQAWQQWNGKEFDSSFMAKEMVLLKRLLDDEGNVMSSYQIVKRFAFTGNGVEGKQLDMFA